MPVRIVIALVSLALAWSPAGADPRDRRERPARIGAFTIKPVLAVEAGYDSNLFLAPRGAVTAGFVALAPSVRIASDWNRHAIRLDASLRAGTFGDGAQDNYLDGALELAGELDITRRARIRLRIGAERGHEGRGTVDTPDTAVEPVVFLRLAAAIRGELRLGAFRIAPFVAWRRLDYHDVGLAVGGQDNQDDRDRVEAEAGVELGYRVRRGYEFLLRGGYRFVDYSADRDDGGVRRDAAELFADAGVRLRLTRLIEGRLVLGIARRDPKDPAIRGSPTLTGAAGITWWPTRRLSAKLGFGRRFAETTIAGTTGAVETEAGLALRFELLRTLGLTAGAAGAEWRFSGAARTDRFLELRLGADWRATRRLTLAPEYRFGRRLSTAAGEGFVRHGFVLTATYRF